MPRTATRDPFLDAYTEGVHDPVGPPVRPRRRRPAPAAPPTGAPPAPPADGHISMAMPTVPVAFGGIVLTPWRQLRRGWVVVDGPTIVEVSERKPQGVVAIPTGGVIMPGMIDLHGHPEYNVFAAWEPPRHYLNRFGWRSSREYDAVVKQPWAALTGGGSSNSLKTTMARYAETRSLVGGVTAIQGASQHYPKQYEALVRNVDLWIFGQHIARSTIDIGRFTTDDAQRIVAAVDEGSVRAHYVHMAEGLPANTACLTEWRRFLDLGLLTSATVLIHGSALGREHLADLRDAGGKLVWSPQSNLRLYGTTTDIAAARELDLPIGLGADWLPSGSPSLLEEMQIARRVANAQGTRATARDMVLMVTRDNARIAGLDDQIGALAPGRPADLVVLQRHHEDGYESVLECDPAEVELVMIGGDLVYGRPDWLGAVSDPAEYEPAMAWGRPMLIDTRFGTPDTDDTDGPARRLETMRSRLIRRYPAVGPVFA
jgi:5-methylthioadenosine/S-adenosylhomocysteine deaminase